MQCRGSVGPDRRCSVSEGMLVLWSPSVWTRLPMTRASACIAVLSDVYGPVCFDILDIRPLPLWKASLDHAEPTFAISTRNRHFRQEAARIRQTSSGLCRYI